MRKLLVFVLILLSLVTIMNIITLYLMAQRASLGDVRHMIELSKTDTSITPEIISLVKSLPTPDPLPGPKGEQGDTGKTGIPGEIGSLGKDGATGKDGKDGKDGIPGIPGREVELTKSSDSGELYYRYTGDTAWTLVPTQ